MPVKGAENGYGRRAGRAVAALLVGALAGAPAAALAPTPETGIGVWYQPGAPADGRLWRAGDAGERLFLRGRVLGEDGGPVAGARVEIWHADAEGVVHADRYRATLASNADGEFELATVLPGYIWGPRHIHVVVTHEAWRRLVTRLFFKRDPVVEEVGRPDLAIVLEDASIGGEQALFGEMQLVLRRP